MADTADLRIKQEKLITEQKEAESELHRCIHENASSLQNQDEYSRKYSALCQRLETLNKNVGAVSDEILEQVARRENIRKILEALRSANELITEFDERLWSTMVDSVVVHSNTKIAIHFRDGTVILVQTEKLIAYKDTRTFSNSPRDV